MRKENLWVLGLLLLMVLTAGVGCKKKVPPPAPVPPPPPPAAAPAPTVTLAANPSTIERGQSTTLSWRSTEATTLTLEPGLGQVPASGTMTVSPYESITYRITAQGRGGSTEASARVTVSERPAPPPPPKPVEEDIDTLWNRSVHDIYFDYDKADIRSDAIPALQGNADFLRAHPNVSIVIQGNCDERGSEEYNLGLGDRRANATKEYMVSLGIPADRMRTMTLGKEKASHCTDEACWQKDRNAHFTRAQ